MSSSYAEFGFGAGDDKVTSGKFERFKAKENEAYRVSFVWWPGKDGKPDLTAASPRFVGAKRFYIQNVGYVLDKGPEVARLAGGPSKMTIATIIAIWPTDRKGNLDKERFVRGDVDVKPWVFSQQVYEQLKRRHDEFPFGQYDLSIACTDTQYQKMDLSPCRESLFAKVLSTEKLSHIADAILASARPIEEGMQGLIARDMSPEQIREKLGAGGGAAVPGASAASTAEVDGMLDDLLA